MEEIKETLNLILKSQIEVQSSVIRLNSKIDAMDEKFEKKFEETNQKITDLREDVKVELNDISDMFKMVFQHMPA